MNALYLHVPCNEASQLNCIYHYIHACTCITKCKKYSSLRVLSIYMYVYTCMYMCNLELGPEVVLKLYSLIERLVALFIGVWAAATHW